MVLAQLVEPAPSLRYQARGWSAQPAVKCARVCRPAHLLGRYLPDGLRS